MEEEKVIVEALEAMPAEYVATVSTIDLSTTALALDEIVTVGTLFYVEIIQHSLIEVAANVIVLPIGESKMTSGTEGFQATRTLDGSAQRSGGRLCNCYCLVGLP